MKTIVEEVKERERLYFGHAINHVMGVVKKECPFCNGTLSTKGGRTYGDYLKEKQ